MRHHDRRKRDRGFNMVELLVVIAIILVVLTFMLPALARAIRSAKATAAGEEEHSERVGEIATAIHEKPKAPAPGEVVARARDVFHREVTSGVPRTMSDLLFVVKNDAEFRAYWFTLLTPSNTQTPEFTRKGYLIAFTPEGKRFELPPVSPGETGSSHIMRWEFISTRLEETGRQDLGGNVIFGDGRREYVPYPTRFPMTRGVAELSHRFYMENVF